eukprot:2378662-Pleurochrysis_carterae.AAC.1
MHKLDNKASISRRCRDDRKESKMGARHSLGEQASWRQSELGAPPAVQIECKWDMPIPSMIHTRCERSRASGQKVQMLHGARPRLHLASLFCGHQLLPAEASSTHTVACAWHACTRA